MTSVALARPEARAAARPGRKAGTRGATKARGGATDRRPAVTLYSDKHGRAPADLLVIAGLCFVAQVAAENALADHHIGCRCKWCRSGTPNGRENLAEDLAHLRYVARTTCWMIQGDVPGQFEADATDLPGTLRALADAMDDLDAGRLTVRGVDADAPAAVLPITG